MEDSVARAMIEGLEWRIGLLQDQLDFIRTQIWGGFGGLFLILAAPWARKLANGAFTKNGNGKKSKRKSKRRGL